MNISKKRLPIGTEDFRKIIEDNYYYVDKTGFIRELLLNGGEVTLFTRPRRFGKSLNMSMLESFFGLNCDKEIFKGLDIMQEPELCEKYMGNFPVISISLKDIDAASYQTAFEMAAMLINAEAGRHQYLLDSERLTQHEKDAFQSLLNRGLSEAEFANSLKLMSQLLEKHYGQKVILLLDEYDVPLARAHMQGYFEQMSALIRSFFHQALKTNDSLQMAVLTGCMRISKESIFTGLNNLYVVSITDAAFGEYFGFTDREIKELLDYYGITDKYDAVKEWYDGYRFGSVKVYCPWDVMCYCQKLRSDPDMKPQNFWSNTSSNDAVRQFILESEKSGTVKREIERLLNGESIDKKIHQELTYQDMYDSIDNLWSVLFTTGYLTYTGTPDGRIFSLTIPNLEVREIFTDQIMDLFRETVKNDGERLEVFCDALQRGDAAGVEMWLGEYLRRGISIRDASGKKEMKENFYHGVLLGILSVKHGWSAASNREAREGYGDILAETHDKEPTGIVIEIMYAHDGNLESSCREALRQLEGKRYADYFEDMGIYSILRYGISCYKKRCRVMLLTNEPAV